VSVRTTIPQLSVRQKTILEHARNHGEVQVDPLAESFNVTPQTIRRDLNLLCRLRLLQRLHGGAVASDGVENLGYEARKRLAADEKANIGRRAAELIPDDSSLFINIGTTTEQVAEYLTQRVGLLVITNNLNVVNTLRRSETIEVMTAGGTVRREDGAIVGSAATEFIERFKVDYAVVGASAIEDDGTVLDYDIREVRVAQAIIRNSRAVILVADGNKFQRNAPVRISNIAEVDYFVTDRPPPAAFTQTCHQHGVTIEVAHGDRSTRL
jgi:DeoR family glycerol-3-phosphate regulon repressor